VHLHNLSPDIFVDKAISQENFPIIFSVSTFLGDYFPRLVIFLAAATAHRLKLLDLLVATQLAAFKSLKVIFLFTQGCVFAG
jgi:hypothetical protein